MEILILYISMLFLIVLILIILNNHIKKIIKFIDQKINEILYIYNSTIYKNKDNIENSKEETLSLFFNNYKKFLKKINSYNISIHYNFFNSLNNDMEYIFSFFEKNFNQETEINKVNNYFLFIFKLCSYYNFMYILFLIFTLGLGNFLIKKDFCKKFDNI